MFLEMRTPKDLVNVLTNLLAANTTNQNRRNAQEEKLLTGMYSDPSLHFALQHTRSTHHEESIRDWIGEIIQFQKEGFKLGYADDTTFVTATEK